MNANTVPAIIAQIEAMPTLPTVAFRVMEVTSNMNSSSNELMKVISPDVSLTTQILKIANSPFYGLTRKVSSLQHAITVLGFKEIRNLVISTVVYKSFNNLKQDKRFDVKGFWRHSFCCGLAAKIIASDLKFVSSELFVAGLIHDIGKLAMYITFPDEYLRLVEMVSPLKLRNTSFEVEKSVFGVSHDIFGKKLLRKWKFPENIINAVGYHHHPGALGKKSLLPVIVCIADILAHIYEIQIEDEEGDYIESDIYYNEIVNLSRSFGIEWSIYDLYRLKTVLVESMDKEVEARSMFL